jgi:hypothetical protein
VHGVSPAALVVHAGRDGCEMVQAHPLPAHRSTMMTSSTRTVLPRLLNARARAHGDMMRALGDTADWSGLERSRILADPEWTYHDAAATACLTMAADLLTEIHDRAAEGPRLGDARTPRAVRARSIPPPAERVTTPPRGSTPGGESRRRLLDLLCQAAVRRTATDRSG